MITEKKLQTDNVIDNLISSRWSPYGFSDQRLSAEQIRSLFEAARWAPSCYNEQPWFYIIATKDDSEEYNKLLSCLTEGNREWARNAPLLVLGVISTKFSRNGEPNRHAQHDLGLASANLTMQAVSMGLAVHQMAGIIPQRAKELYNIPKDYEVMTGLAIGYPDSNADIDEVFRKRDEKRRPRKKLSEFLFESGWGRPAETIDPERY